jgi:hypothetical protein
VYSIFEEDNIRPSNLDIDLCIKLVRIKNTIGVYNLYQSDAAFLKFDSFFTKEIVQEIVIKLEMSESRGLGFFSKKYNVLLGGDPIIGTNSYFKLASLPNNCR